jgi:hypothetical protein
LAATAPAAPGGDPAVALVIAGVSLSTPLILRTYGTVAAKSEPGQSIIVEIRRDNRGAVRLTTLTTRGSSVLHVNGYMSRPAAADVTAFSLSTIATAAVETTVDVKEKASVEHRRVVLALAASNVFAISGASNEVPMRAAAARIQAPCREPGWVDSEVSDAALHLIAAMTADAADLRANTGRERALAARVPATITACCIWHPNAMGTGVGSGTIKSPSWPTAAARILPEKAGSRSKISDHVLVGDGGKGGPSALITVNAMLMKAMRVGAGALSATATASSMGGVSGSNDAAIETAAREPAVSLRHEVSWAVTPGDARRRDKNDNNTITKETTSFVALPPVLGTGTATNVTSSSTRRHTSSAVALDLAAALAISQDAVLARTLSKGLRVGTVGSALGSAAGGRAAETVQPHDKWAAAAAIRGAALHAVARTLPQEVPGLDGAAVDSDPADAAIFGGGHREAASGRRSNISSGDDDTAAVVGAFGVRTPPRSPSVVAIADGARHRYGAAIRGSTESLPTLYPGVQRPAALNTTYAADAAAAATADVSVLITGGTGALVKHTL